MQALSFSAEVMSGVFILSTTRKFRGFLLDDHETHTFFHPEAGLLARVLQWAFCDLLFTRLNPVTCAQFNAAKKPCPIAPSRHFGWQSPYFPVFPPSRHVFRELRIGCNRWKWIWRIWFRGVVGCWFTGVVSNTEICFVLCSWMMGDSTEFMPKAVMVYFKTFWPVVNAPVWLVLRRQTTKIGGV
jgi:hypothetical protein